MSQCGTRIQGSLHLSISLFLPLFTSHWPARSSCWGDLELEEADYDVKGSGGRLTCDG